MEIKPSQLNQKIKFRTVRLRQALRPLDAHYFIFVLEYFSSYLQSIEGNFCTLLKTATRNFAPVDEAFLIFPLR